MTWDGDIRQQVLETFREAQRRPGELDTSEDGPRSESLRAPVAILVEKQEERRTAAPISSQEGDRPRASSLAQLVDFTGQLGDLPSVGIGPNSTQKRRRRIVGRVCDG